MTMAADGTNEPRNAFQRDQRSKRTIWVEIDMKKTEKDCGVGIEVEDTAFSMK